MTQDQGPGTGHARPPTAQAGTARRLRPSDARLARALGAAAILGGWVCIWLGVFLGLERSEFLGMSNTAGPAPLVTVYGFSAAVVLWSFVAAALIAALPVGMAMLAPDPRPGSLVGAAIMVVIAVLLFPDELGRAFGLPLLPGAVLVALGGNLLYSDAAALGSDVDGATAGAVATAGEPPTAGQGPQVAEPVPSAGPRAAARKPPALDRECPWCSARVPAGSTTCPSCRATVAADDAADAIQLPGVTEVSPSLRAYAEQVRAGKRKRRSLSNLLSIPSGPVVEVVPDPSERYALLPPNEAVRAEMARLDAEIASRAVLPGTDPVELPDGAVSPGDAPKPASPGSGGEPEPDATTPPAKSRRRPPRA